MNRDSDVREIRGVGPKRAAILHDCGYTTIGDVLSAGVEGLVSSCDIGKSLAEKIVTNADPFQEDTQVSRDTKLTRDRQENIANMLENGQSVAAACRCNDISRKTFYQWLDRGDDQEEGIFSDFSSRVTRARGVGEAELVDELIEQCREKGDTRTMLSIIKSRYPESWGDADAGEEGGTVNIHLSPTTSE